MAEAQAVLRFVRVSPRKARPVVDLIRGQQVPMALAMLRNLPRHASKVVEKILRSAVANAEQKEMGDSESMVVSKAFVDCGPTLKRFRCPIAGACKCDSKADEPHYRRGVGRKREGERTKYRRIRERTHFYLSEA